MTRPATACFLRLSVAATLTVVALAPTVAEAQRSAGIEVYEKADLSAIPEPHKTWVIEEVGHLITEEEFNVFLRLDSEAKFERFREEFWLNRDPTPGTPRNEYYEQHYERLAYANKFYGRSSPLPGWRTDRGRAFIMLGEPRMIERVPSEMLLYPLEVWFYSADPELGLPPFFYLMFFQRYNTGDFQLYSPLSDGPRKLFNGAGLREVDRRMEEMSLDPMSGGRPGVGYAPTGYGEDAEAMRSVLIETHIDLANAAFSYFPSEAGLEYGVTPLASELLLGSIANIKEVLMPDATWAYKVLTGETDSDVRFETLELQALAVPLIDVDGEPFIHFASKARGQDLHVGEYSEDYYFTFRALGSIVDDGDHVLQNFESSMSGDLEEEQARQFTRNPFIYMDIVPTLPGRQEFSLMLENVVAHSFGRREITLDVPRVHPERPMLAGPVVALDAQAREYDAFGSRYPFQYRDLAMVPSVDGTFVAGQPIHVFEQVLLPAGAEGAVTARYALVSPSGSTVREESVQLLAAGADKNGVMTHLFTIDTAGLSVGSYRLKVSLDENSLADRYADVEIKAPRADPERPFINAQPAAPPIDVSVALQRAQQYRIIGDMDSAIRWLDYAQEREPGDPEIRDRYVELLEETGRYDTLIDVLMPLSAEDPRDEKILLKLAKAYGLSGQHYDAIRFYERARLVMDEESVDILNALAAEYHADGRTDKAQALLQLSLELEAEQPEIRLMLERISQTTGEAAR